MLVTNLNPIFSAARESGTRPKLIKDACSYIQSHKIFLWSGFRLWSKDASRTRGFNLHRKRAIQSGVEALAFHANLLTGVVHSSCTEMSDMCGLSTTGKSGVKSISRFTRMIDTLEQFNLIRCDRIWDRAAGMYLPKLIQVTSLFWEMCGIPTNRLQAEQRKALGRQKKSKLEAGESAQLVAEFGIGEAEQAGRRNFIVSAFKARKASSAARAAERKLKRLEQADTDKQIDIIVRDLISTMPAHELKTITPKEMKRRAQYELGKIRNIAKQ